MLRRGLGRGGVEVPAVPLCHWAGGRAGRQAAGSALRL